MKKDREYLFVDAYNIINAWQDLKELSKVDLNLAREKLIEIMAEYQAYTDSKVIIVFDAHLVKGGTGKKDKVYNLEVVYTKEYETADSYIEKTIDSIGRNKKVKVATNDWIEQQIILGRGATRISARELKVEIEDIKRDILRKNKKRKEKNNKKDKISEILSEDILEKLEKIRRNS